MGTDKKYQTTYSHRYEDQLDLIKQHHGSCSYQDSEEGSSCHHRKVLYATDARLPHQQTHLRGGGHHTKQETPQQDRRVYHSSHEEDRTRTCEGYLRQTSRGRERTKGQLRSRDFCVGARSYWGGHRHQRNAESFGFHWFELAGDAAHYSCSCVLQVTLNGAADSLNYHCTS